MNTSAANAVYTDKLSIFYGRSPAITDVSISIKEGEFVGIIGPNGSGKSTLMKALIGLVPVTSGDISVFGNQPGKGKVSIGYVPQFANMDKHFPITVIEVVMTGLMGRGLPLCHRYTKQDRDKAMELLCKVDMSDFAQRSISGLSGGEFQKMLIARALATSPRILLLDEPTASVDAPAREQIYELLTKLNNGITVVLISHDLLMVSAKMQRMICLNNRVVYDGAAGISESIIHKMYSCPVCSQKTHFVHGREERYD